MTQDCSSDPLIIYIPTNVNAIFLTQEEVVSNAIVTLCGKIVRVIRTMTITVAHVGFGDALSPIVTSKLVGGA